jgi:putative glycosyltransferase (TIGR04372 family)
MVPAVLAVFLVRMLRPVVLIRFGRMGSDSIGHLAFNTELYLCERDAGLHPQRTIDFMWLDRLICNEQLKTMVDRTLSLLPNVRVISAPISFMLAVDRVNRFLPGGEKHAIVGSNRNTHCLPARTGSLSFTPEEECLGWEALRDIGIGAGTPFVCFHARTPAYLDIVHPGFNWHYHKYRDSTIHNYIPAAEELVRRGYFAIRMGAVVKEALNTTNPMIIDYATRHRTDFLDIFLCAKCRFFIGDTSGIAAAAAIFRRPAARVNIIPLEYLAGGIPGDLFIPKKIWLRHEHRFLTVREILESGIGRFERTEQYEQLGIEVVENTPEEITALVLEMDERLNGTWETTKEDEQLQRLFWSLLKPSKMNQAFEIRIGAEFLRQHRALLN